MLESRKKVTMIVSVDKEKLFHRSIPYFNSLEVCVRVCV